MYRNHTTREGDTILICQMDNRHLLNMIKRILGKIEQAVNQQDSRKLCALHNLLPHYVLEAMLRPGLPEIVQPLMQSVYGRSSPVPTGDDASSDFLGQALEDSELESSLEKTRTQRRSLNRIRVGPWNV